MIWMKLRSNIDLQKSSLQSHEITVFLQMYYTSFIFYIEFINVAFKAQISGSIKEGACMSWGL